MTARYRADHVGSLLRPPELLGARSATTDSARLREIENRHILRVLTKQQELGLDVFTDGELRRSNFMSDLMDAVEGFDQGDAVARSWQAAAPSSAPSSVPGVAIARLRPARRLTAHEVPFLQQHSPGALGIPGDRDCCSRRSAR